MGRPDFKSGKEPLAGPWWVRLPLSSATTPSAADRRCPIDHQISQCLQLINSAVPLYTSTIVQYSVVTSAGVEA